MRQARPGHQIFKRGSEKVVSGDEITMASGARFRSLALTSGAEMKRLIKRLVNSVLGWIGLEIRRRPRFSENINLLEAVLQGIVSSGRVMNIVQVGANDGLHDDLIHNFLMKNRELTRALMVEPQPEIVEILGDTYFDHPSVTIFSGAVGDGDSLILHRIKPEFWSSFHPPYLRGAPVYTAPSGVASAKKDHVLKAARKHLDRTVIPEEAVESIEVPCKQLRDLLSVMNFPKDIHLLQVDAEGEDDQVIYASDIEWLRPTVINYESKHLSEEDRTALETHLTQNGYEIYRWSTADTLAILRPTTAPSPSS